MALRTEQLEEYISLQLKWEDYKRGSLEMWVDCNQKFNFNKLNSSHHLAFN